MLNDEALNGLTWGDLERALGAIAAPANMPLARDVATALWKESQFLPEPMNLERVLAASILLAGPACFPGSSDEAPSPS